MEYLNNAYPYRELNCDEEEIRLIELSRRLQPSEPLQGRVIYKSLCQKPDYHALSYVWGDPTVQSSIELEGTDCLAVTVNLEKALRRITLMIGVPTVTLWVDQICINQRNVEERNRQISIMWKIYANANIVLAWLDAEIGDDRVISHIRYMVQDESASRESLIDSPDFWLPLTAITENGYWDRVWTQQEFTYAQNLIIICRDDSFPLQALVFVLSLLEDFITEYSVVLPPDDIKKWSRISPANLCFRLQDSSRVGPTTKKRLYHSLYDAIDWTSHLQASDPRDRIFGILSLVQGYDTENEHEIEINYQFSIRDLYVRIAQLFIHKYTSLVFFNLAGLTNIGSDEYFPSWLPCQGRKSARGNPTGPSRFFQAQQAVLDSIPKTADVLPFISSDHATLHVRGMRISPVCDVCKHMNYGVSDYQMGPFLKHWEAFIARAREIGTEVCHPGSKDGVDAFLRIMFIVRTEEEMVKSEGRKPMFTKHFSKVAAESQKPLPDLENAFKEYQNPKYEAEMWRLLMSTVKAATMSRELLLAEDGTMGLGPLLAAPGDEIWMLFRSPLPTILRPQGNGYSVVGPAHIDYFVQKQLDASMANFQPGNSCCGAYELQSVTLV